MKRYFVRCTFALATFIATSSIAQISLPGTTFTTRADSDYPYCCSADPGFTATAGVFYSSDYTTRANSEFNLNGFGSGRAGQVENLYATVSFVFSGFRRNFVVDPEPVGFISALAYRGDNLPSIVDHRPVNSIGSIGFFDLSMYDIGDTISLDVTSSFRTAALDRYAAYGIGLGYGGFRDSFASFSDFRLNVSSGPVTPIPEPETYALMLAGLAALGYAGKRHRKAALI